MDMNNPRHDDMWRKVVISWYLMKYYMGLLSRPDNRFPSLFYKCLIIYTTLISQIPVTKDPKKLSAIISIIFYGQFVIEIGVHTKNINWCILWYPKIVIVLRYEIKHSDMLMIVINLWLIWISTVRLRFANNTTLQHAASSHSE